MHVGGQQRSQKMPAVSFPPFKHCILCLRPVMQHRAVYCTFPGTKTLPPPQSPVCGVVVMVGLLSFLSRCPFPASPTLSYHGGCKAFSLHLRERLEEKIPVCMHWEIASSSIWRGGRGLYHRARRGGFCKTSPSLVRQVDGFWL